VLAVDNFNGIKLLNRAIQVDHVEQYKIPKYKETAPEDIRRIWEEGCAPKAINIPEDQLVSEVKQAKREQKRKIKELEQLVDLSEKEMSKDFRKARKELKKEKKELKRLKVREDKLNRRSPTPDEERGHADDEGRWDLRKKKLTDQELLDDEKFYGSNDHFNFGSKKRKEVPPPPTHNVRPDFDKADWRDIELFKLVREHERREKGEKEVHWKPEEHYVPGRLKPGPSGRK
jgi:RNA-binding motif X-linked protein 2